MPARIHAIIGPMFAGKSTELLRRTRRVQLLDRQALLVVHSLDLQRWPGAAPAAHTHNGDHQQAVHAERLDEVDALVSAETRLIAIDEAQFFPDLIPFLERHEHRDIDIVFAGLNGDARRKPFGAVLDAIALCDSVLFLTALDMVARDGSDAVFSLRLPSDDHEQVAVGGADRYVAVSRSTYLARNHAR